MREDNLLAMQPRAFVVTTDSNHDLHSASLSFAIIFSRAFLSADASGVSVKLALIHFNADRTFSGAPFSARR